MDKAMVELDNRPDWRWAVVYSMAEEGKTLSRRPEDLLFTRGVRFYRRWKKNCVADLPQIKRDYPDLYPAHSLYKNEGSERWIVEAGLLTNVSHKELGDFVAQPEEVINTYATYFFDVREKMNSPGYVLNRVLSPNSQKTASARDSDFMFKAIAYNLGWSRFVEFIGGKEFSEDLRRFLVSNFKDRVYALGWLATRSVSLNNFTSLQVIEQCSKLIATEQERAGAASNQDETLSMMGALLNQCKVTILPYGEKLEINEPRALEMAHGIKPALKYGDPIPLEGK